MNELPPDLEQRLAELSEADFDALLARVRPPGEETDPMVRAARALRSSRGLDRKAKATPEEAVDALRRYATGI